MHFHIHRFRGGTVFIGSANYKIQYKLIEDQTTGILTANVLTTKINEASDSIRSIIG